MISKLLFFVFAFCFLLSFQSFSEEKNIQITMTEWNILKKNFKELETSNEMKVQLLNELKRENENNLEELKNLKALNQKIQDDLKKCEESLKKSKEETTKMKIKNGVICFGVGAGIGALICLWGGKK